MFDETELAIVRRAYALQVAAAAGVADTRLIAALSSVRRERFLPPGPWPLDALGMDGVTTPDADPVYLYQDIVVPILPTKGLNNGQPSFVTRLIAAAGVRSGDRVVHVGAGTGYYTAILAELVGGTGRVLGLEVEPELARRAAANLAGWAGVTIVEADGWRQPLEPADVVLVNAGAASISETWRDALVHGGRLILPLAGRPPRTTPGGKTRGVVFRFEKQGDTFAAAVVSPAVIYPCLGGGDEAAEARLAEALAAGGARRVSRLCRGRPAPGEACWLAGDGWYLA